MCDLVTCPEALVHFSAAVCHCNLPKTCLEQKGIAFNRSSTGLYVQVLNERPSVSARNMESTCIVSWLQPMYRGYNQILISASAIRCSNFLTDAPISTPPWLCCMIYKHAYCSHCYPQLTTYSNKKHRSATSLQTPVPWSPSGLRHVPMDVLHHAEPAVSSCKSPS